MAKLRRKLFTLLAAISLLLCLATAALWVRSGRAFDRFEYRSGNKVVFGVETLRGGVGFFCGTSWDENIQYQDGWKHTSFRFDRDQRYDTSMFAARKVSGSGNGVHTEGWFLHAPLWLPCLAFAVLPVVGFIKHRRRAKRARLGLCPVCGYDLRATPERCPECGTMPETMKSER